MERVAFLFALKTVAQNVACLNPCQFKLWFIFFGVGGLLQKNWKTADNLQELQTISRLYILRLIKKAVDFLAEDLDGVCRSAGMSRSSCNQARGKWLIPIVMTPAQQAQQFSSADTDQ